MLAVRFEHFYRTLPKYHEGERYQVIGTVQEEPKLAFGKQNVKVKTAEGFRLTVVTGVAPLYQYGDILQIDGVFTKKQFQNFEYWVAYFPTLQKTQIDHNFVTAGAYSLRSEAKKLYESTLPPVSSSLLLGIVLGGKHGMPEEFHENLQTVGVLHVIAASGMNVSFVAAFLVAGLGRFFRRPVALFTAVVGIGFYVIVAGFEPSIVRAAIMSTLAMVAAILGRQSIALITLFITGYCMLLVSPGLWEDRGFQLSFLSTLGILAVKPLLFPKSGLAGVGGFSVKEDIGTTTAAQIAALPILLGVFGNYGLLSIGVNALVLWTIPILMTLGSLAIIFGSIFEPLGKLYLFVSFPFLWFFEMVVTFFGGIGWVLTIPQISPAVWIGYYLLLTAWLFAKRKKVKERKETLLVREV